MDYFPLSIALGKAFCNRKNELQILRHNLVESRPALISSPRRYGKTSLALNAINRAKLPYAHFDFLAAVSESDIEKIILQGIGGLISRNEKTASKILKVATDFFSGLNLKFTFDRLGLAIEVGKKTTAPAPNILEVLEKAEKLSEKIQRQIVLFFDEFQQIYTITENPAIESIIRQVAQSSKKLAFIFSGSNRHLLNAVFNDRNRPFYKLCDRIALQRIDESAYVNYFNVAARAAWKKELDAKTIIAIFNCTARHPYYVNLLCSRLWRLSKTTEDAVFHTWHDYIQEEHSQVASELDLLSTSQRKLLVMLARHGGACAPRSRDFQVLSAMPGTTITQALSFLEKQDYVYQDENGCYKLIDPMLQNVLGE